jgi:hypothetical protein
MAEQLIWPYGGGGFPIERARARLSAEECTPSYGTGNVGIPITLAQKLTRSKPNRPGRESESSCRVSISPRLSRSSRSLARTRIANRT